MRRLLLAGLAGTLTLLALALVGAASAVELQYTLRPVASGFGSITFLTAPRGSADLYVMERAGKVWVLVNARTRRVDPFADFSGIVRHDQGDNGLFSLAFSPDYATNHLFYVDYIDANNDIRIDRAEPHLGDRRQRTPESLAFLLRPPDRRPADGRGRYFYADFCNGAFWSFMLPSGHATNQKRELFRMNNPTTFGEDARGELYAGNLQGQVFKLSPF
jgi:hypothetical protein